MLIHDEAKRVGRFHFWLKKLLSASLHAVVSFLAISNMAAILTESRIVALEGLKAKFVITKEEDIVQIEEKVFVRLSPTSHTLIALVAEKNPLAPSPLPKRVHVIYIQGVATSHAAPQHGPSRHDVRTRGA